MRNENLLKELTQLWGVAGYEKEVRKYIEEKAAPYADEMMVDAVGNLIVLKKGTGGENAKKIISPGARNERGSEAWKGSDIELTSWQMRTEGDEVDAKWSQTEK